MDNFTVVEVAADEFAVRLVFLEGCDGEVVVCEDRVGDGGDAGEEGVGFGGVGSGQWFDEDDAVRGGLVAGVEAEDVERHFCFVFVNRMSGGKTKSAMRTCLTICGAKEGKRDGWRRLEVDEEASVNSSC